MKFTVLLFALATASCASVPMPTPAQVSDVAQSADQICGLAPLLPSSSEKAELLAACERHEDLQTLAEAYARCPGAK